jgi:hypothetical protein
LQKEYIFNLVHLEQEEGWQLNKATIVIYTNFFSAQQEHISIISPSKRITTTSLKQYIECSNAKDLMGGIRNKEN